MNNVLGIITARSGSKGIKNKNILFFNNKPLIYYTINFAKKLPFLNKLILSTDSKKYLKIAKKYHNFENNLRPKYLSGDNVKTIDVIKYEFKRLQKIGMHYDIIIIFQPVCPFRKKEIFVKAYNLIAKKKTDSVITLKKVKEHPLKMYKFNNKKIKHYLHDNNEKKSFFPRQRLKKLYSRQGSMYMFKSDLLKKNQFISSKTIGLEVSDRYALNLDTNEDLILAKNYFSKKENKL